MAPLQVQVLGKLRLRYDGDIVDQFPTRRVEELLAFLVVHQQRQHSREMLIDLLWSDRSPSNGRASLSTELWRLRKVLKGLSIPTDGFLSTSRDWISFNPTHPTTFDVADFERHLKHAEGEIDPDRRKDELLVSVEMYSGVFCEGLYSDWCLIERERLERKYLWALGQLTAEMIKQESYQEATRFGEKIVRRDPLREEAHRALMLCYWKTGNSAQSLRQFQTCARLLQLELGIMPLPETINLYRTIVEDRIGGTTEETTQRQHQRQLVTAFDDFQSAAAELDALFFSRGESPRSPQS
jgi:DNA-binding SARP family transcriptional activator